MSNTSTDMTYDEAFAWGEVVHAKHPGAQIYFKFTCSACGERVCFAEPNTLYKSGECCHCGFVQPVTHYGALIVLSKTSWFSQEIIP